MAANWQFAQSLREPIQHCKLDLLGRVDTGDGIRRINSLFRELVDAVSILDTRHRHRVGGVLTVQRLAPARGMLARCLRKIHAKIKRRPSTRSRLFCILLILFINCTRDKQRDTTMSWPCTRATFYFGVNLS